MRDETFALLREGYLFLPTRRSAAGCDAFELRLLGQRTTCITGPDAPELFYSERFERHSAMPGRIKRTLFGSDGVQTLDGPQHRARKAMFMALMTPERLEVLDNWTISSWEEAVNTWREGVPRIVLFDAARDVLFRAACAWTGVPVDALGPTAAADFVAMVDGFASLGPRYWKARAGRMRLERVTKALIERVRGGDLHVPDDSAAGIIARHTDDGAPLASQIAAVELLNVIRPIVAISWFITDAAHALHTHPEWNRRLRDEPSDVLPFVHEVRRFYPFTPFLGARVREPFEWQGLSFPKGRLVLLDVYGANHDARMWADPQVFDPTRFRDRVIGPFDFIPQGGGDSYSGHRCAGERLTIRQVEIALRVLTSEVEYSVPQQDLDFSLRRIPTAPQSGFVIEHVSVAMTDSASRLPH